MKKVKEKSQD